MNERKSNTLKREVETLQKQAEGLKLKAKEASTEQSAKVAELMIELN